MNLAVCVQCVFMRLWRNAFVQDFVGNGRFSFES